MLTLLIEQCSHLTILLWLTFPGTEKLVLIGQGVAEDRSIVMTDNTQKSKKKRKKDTTYRRI